MPTKYSYLAIWLVTIVIGIVWVGAGIFYKLIVKPPGNAIGAAMYQFKQNQARRHRAPLFMGSAILLQEAARTLQSLLFPDGLNLDGIHSGIGLGYSIGARPV